MGKQGDAHRQSGTKADVVWSDTTITPQMRTTLKQHQAKCIWLTGLSGAGKSSLANTLEKALFDQGYHTMLLDGDNIRHGLCKDLGMTPDDRTENIRRVGELAKLMTDAGVIVITAFISPFKADRDAARQLFSPGNFIEVYVKAPLEVCEQRDPKGLYQKARSGKIRDFTGIDSPYEAPSDPELIADTTQMSTEQITAALLPAIIDNLALAD